ncbi:XRE family transcriptional regulator [Streptococcus minor]|uniref:XRE family transcriptional regulator n=1 Tax=Streptococcus minor TaxID=229549 RepID=A0A3P1V4K7_9STRE|nr:helix-turn-helix transcriptional regulator [Streptococcus minor]RRD29142.1 XRE family transcriptional regulator [Streptococcus minor]
MQIKLKEYRDKKKLTQQELSQKSGVSRAVIVGLESGSYRETSTVTLKKLATALEVPVKDLFF